MLGEEAESMLWWDGSTGECRLPCGTSQGLKDWVGPLVSEGMTSDGQALPHLCFDASTRDTVWNWLTHGLDSREHFLIKDFIEQLECTFCGLKDK